MRNVFLTTLFAFAALGLSGLSRADTLILKNGSKIEGKLISQNEKEIRFETGREAKRVRTFRAELVESVVVVPPDQLALNGIKEMLPAADMLDATQYSRMIEGAPKNFLRAFPDSKLRAEVEQIIKSLEEERQKVLEGSVKIGGEWILAEQIEADPYNHSARIAFIKIKELFRDGDTIGALRAFDALEEEYPDSVTYPKAVVGVKNLLGTHAADLEKLVGEARAEKELRDTRLGRMGPNERDRAIAAFESTLEAFKKEFEADKAANVKWLRYNMSDIPSLGAALSRTQKEITRLEKLDLESMTERAEALSSSIHLVEKGDFAVAAEKLSKFDRTFKSKFALDIKKKVDAGKKELDKIAAEKARAESVAEKNRKREEERIAREKEEAEKRAARNSASDEEGEEDPDSETGADDSGDEEDGEEEGDGDPEDEASGGFTFVHLLLVLVPVLGIVTFLSMRSAKNNEVEDFVPNEPDDGGQD